MKFTLTPVVPENDAPVLHSWVSQEYARFWGLLGATVEQVEQEHRGIAADPNQQAWLGMDNGTPAFLMERYEPAHSELADHYDVQLGDAGMHLLVAPAPKPQRGYTTAVFRRVLDFIFADQGVGRVVVEPDVRNRKIQILNERMGFVRHSVVSLTDKDAALSFCTRDSFSAARAALYEGVSA